MVLRLAWLCTPLRFRTAEAQERLPGPALGSQICREDAHDSSRHFTLYDMRASSGADIPYQASKANIADSLNIIVQIDRRPGSRFVSEVLEIRGYSPEAEQYDLCELYRRAERL